MIRLAPSLLAADFANLEQAVKAVEKAGCEYLHLDIMDGHFVPNITFGPDVVKALRPHSRMVFDVHLMIEKPDLYINAFADAGADLICVHAEACIHLHRTIQSIKERGLKSAVALNPATPLDSVEEILPYIDMVLIMSVNPGYGGQKYIPTMTDKVARLKRMAEELKLDLDIQVDGGMTAETAPLVVNAGANIIVAGSAIFGKPDISTAVQDLRKACGQSNKTGIWL